MGSEKKKNSQKTKTGLPKRLRREESTQRAFTAAAFTQTIGNISFFFFVLARLHLHRVQKKSERGKKTTKKAIIDTKDQIYTELKGIFFLFFSQVSLSGPQDKSGGATSSTCCGTRGDLVGRAVDGRRETNGGRGGKQMPSLMAQKRINQSSSSKNTTFSTEVLQHEYIIYTYYIFCTYIFSKFNP